MWRLGKTTVENGGNCCRDWGGGGTIVKTGGTTMEIGGTIVETGGGGELL